MYDVLDHNIFQKICWGFLHHFSGRWQWLLHTPSKGKIIESIFYCESEGAFLPLIVITCLVSPDITEILIVSYYYHSVLVIYNVWSKKDYDEIRALLISIQLSYFEIKRYSLCFLINLFLTRTYKCLLLIFTISENYQLLLRSFFHSNIYSLRFYFQLNYFEVQMRINSEFQRSKSRYRDEYFLFNFVYIWSELHF